VCAGPERLPHRIRGSIYVIDVCVCACVYVCLISKFDPSDLLQHLCYRCVCARVGIRTSGEFLSHRICCSICVVHVCLCVCVCVCVYVGVSRRPLSVLRGHLNWLYSHAYIYIHIYIYTSIYIYIYVYIHIHTNMSMYTYIHSLHMNVCIYINVYTYMCVVYIYISVHVHT